MRFLTPNWDVLINTGRTHSFFHNHSLEVQAAISLGKHFFDARKPVSANPFIGVSEILSNAWLLGWHQEESDYKQMNTIYRRRLLP